MLSDTRAVEIIARARQKNVADAGRSSRDFDRIFEDFFGDVDVSGQRLIDLGPGQYDFARRMRDGGAVVENVDFDPAVVELGRYLGFEVELADLRLFDRESRFERLDGVFCKFAINAFWFDEPSATAAYTAEVTAMLKPGGWGWIAPWNGLGKLERSDEQVQSLLLAQRKSFEAAGWKAHDLNGEQARYYGVQGNVANNVLFTRNLPRPRTLNPQS